MLLMLIYQVLRLQRSAALACCGGFHTTVADMKFSTRLSRSTTAADTPFP